MQMNCTSFYHRKKTPGLGFKVEMHHTLLDKIGICMCIDVSSSVQPESYLFKSHLLSQRAPIVASFSWTRFCWMWPQPAHIRGPCPLSISWGEKLVAGIKHYVAYLHHTYPMLKWLQRGTKFIFSDRCNEKNIILEKLLR